MLESDESHTGDKSADSHVVLLPITTATVRKQRHASRNWVDWIHVRLQRAADCQQI